MNRQIQGIVQQIKRGQNPQQIMLNMLSQQTSPMSANLYNLIQQGRTGEIEQIARNIMKQQGRDFDTEFKAFRASIGL